VKDAGHIGLPSSSRNIVEKEISTMAMKKFSSVFARTREGRKPEQEDILTLPQIAPSFNFKTIHQRVASLQIDLR
jgi:hypothetical protein